LRSHEGFGVEPGIRAGPVADRCLGFTGVKVDKPVFHIDHKVKAGLLRALQRRNDPFHGNRGRHGQTYGPGRLHIRYPRQCTAPDLLTALRGITNDPPCFGRNDAPGRSLEKPNAERSLQRLDAMADRRLLQPDRDGCPGEVPFFCNSVQQLCVQQKTVLQFVSLIHEIQSCIQALNEQYDDIILVSSQ
jgi:hypothetical protein